MACNKPVLAWRTDDGNVVFAERGRIKTQLLIRCRQCTGCRLEDSRQWAVRCMHESQMHKENCTITLTYNNKNKPTNDSLEYRDYQLFMKRTVKHFKPQKVRFYMGGEYGEQNGRPHFHACLFGISFRQDRKYHQTTPAGFKIYQSATLDKLWGKGYASIGELTFESAAYIARYIMKKVTGGSVINPDTLEKWYNDTTSKTIKEMYYKRINMETGEIYNQTPEFNQMSRKPGLGLSWLKKFQDDVFPEGKVVTRGHKSNSPRYYNKKYEEICPEGYDEMLYQRHMEAITHAHDNTPERLEAKEKVAQARNQLLRRTI